MSLTEESKVCINDEIYHFVSCINVVAVTEPIDCHISRCHGVEHKGLKVSQVGIGEEDVCHVTIITTGSAVSLG